VLNRRALLAASLAGTSLAAVAGAPLAAGRAGTDAMRMRPTLTAADVQRVVAACRREAESHGWRVVIAVVDDGGNAMYLERLDGALPIAATAALGKAQTAAALRMSSGAAAELLKEMPGMIATHAGIPLRGAQPLLWQGECVGAVGVAGMEAHQDEQVATAGAAALA
jgi:glc operon protein GlcG